MKASLPLAVYQEQGLDTRREFRLFPTELQVTASGPFGSHSEATIPLGAIRAVPNRICQRHRIFVPFLIATIVASFLAAASCFGPFSTDVRFLGGTLGIAGVVIFGILTLFVSPRVEYRQFLNETGIVAFDIAATGADRDRFPQFVNEIVQTIEAARLKSPPAS